MVRVLTYVDSGELVESDDEDDTGSQDTGQGQPLPNDDEISSETDDSLEGGAGAVIPVGPAVQVGVVVQAEWPKPLSGPQKKLLFGEMGLRYRTLHPNSVQVDGALKMRPQGVDADFLRALKEQLHGRARTVRAPRLDTGMCTFLYWVAQMATLNTWNVPAPKQPVVKKTAEQKAAAKQRSVQVTAALAAAKPLADAMRLENQLARVEEDRLHQVAMDEFLGAAEASTLQYFGSSLHRGLLRGSGPTAESGLGCLLAQDIGEAEVIFHRVSHVLDGLVNYPWYAVGMR
jgi:hypothetical protein